MIRFVKDLDSSMPEITGLNLHCTKKKFKRTLYQDILYFDRLGKTLKWCNLFHKLQSGTNFVFFTKMDKSYCESTISKTKL